MIITGTKKPFDGHMTDNIDVLFIALGMLIQDSTVLTHHQYNIAKYCDSPVLLQLSTTSLV